MIEDKIFPLPSATVNAYKEHMETIKDGIADLKKLQAVDVDVSDILRELNVVYNSYEIKFEALKNSNKLSNHVNLYAINAAITALNKIFDEEGTQG